MNAKQKRAFNAAQRAIHHLSEVTQEDPEGFNAMIALLTGTAGTMMGAMSAAHSLSIDDLHASTTKASQFMQQEAAKGYGAYTAAEASAATKS
tara:strand:- start:6709 stop:6987 length:279 start_codon:yes stop_codon:yes gene_type:complete